MNLFEDDEEGYLQWAETNPDGFILNCYGAISSAAIRCFQAEMGGGVSRRLSQPFTAILFGP